MIQFEKNSTNIITVTLTELSISDDTLYLFLFKNQQSKVPYYFISTDTSSYKRRYNQFSVTEKQSPNTLNGEVLLGLPGWYDYIAYETSLTSTSGLTTAEDAIPYIVKIVEYGLVNVPIGELDIDAYEPANNTNIVYNPE